MSTDPAFHDPEPEERGMRGYTGIGDVLRLARERAGLTLPDVAAQLRISETYLAAIEQGRFELLPGRSYVLGFLRSYAAFLGLNAEKVVSQYKVEADDDFARQQKLKFPTVRPEGRTPGLWLLPVVMILAAGAYLAWYGWKTELVSFDDIVPEVPERLLAENQAAAPAPSGPATAGAAASGPRASVSGSAGAGIAAAPPAAALDPRDADAGEAGDLRLAAPAAPAGTAMTGSSATETTGPAAAGTAATESTVPDSAASEATMSDSTMSASTAQDSAAPGTAAAEAEATAPAAATPPASAAIAPDQPPPLPSDPEAVPGGSDVAGEATTAVAAAEPEADGTPLADEPIPEGRVFGAPDARVVLRARADTWVQVEDAQRNLLLTRVLKAGDVYGAPNQSGLVLMTGNAGGLVVEVDGAPVPPLGPRGAVRRNVSLDPERLLDGSQAIN